VLKKKADKSDWRIARQPGLKGLAYTPRGAGGQSPVNGAKEQAAKHVRRRGRMDERMEKQSGD
jgi:hypothetical protein